MYADLLFCINQPNSLRDGVVLGSICPLGLIKTNQRVVVAKLSGPAVQGSKPSCTGLFATKYSSTGIWFATG
jgi:hypothetical protein